jgi:hypothetical protein
MHLALYVSCATFLGLLVSTTGHIDVTKLDSDVFKKHTLMEIVRSVAVQYPEPIHDALKEMAANRTYARFGISDNQFNKISSVINNLAVEPQCNLCKVTEQLTSHVD